MSNRDAGTLTPTDLPSPMAVTWNWVDASACEVKSRSATPAEARSALNRGAMTESRRGRPVVVTRAGWFAVS